ncbi:acVLRF1 family peptidyl-tRNA hydrolase [Acidothermaceae bacterium B102]|nr:acVLRF1 family peptidyl-tRNA hydrolase [Acidothermaceae bacterium B102]
MPPERLERWLDRFAAEHGGVAVEASSDGIVLLGADGSRADVEAPFPPMRVRAEAPYRGLLEHVTRPRVIGVLLVRKGGYAAGVFVGAELVVSKVGSRHVQGRSAAGGWSQQRFARRREGQAREAFEAAADTAVRVIVPELARLDAVVTGGDRPALAAVLEDPRLVGVRRMVVERVLDVVDPRLVVLQETPKRFRAARISVSACD